MIIVRINKDGSMNDIKIDKVTKTNIMGKLKKCANNTCVGGVKELYYWNHEENIIKCYGWYEGEYGFENDHDLIPNGNSIFLEEDSSEKKLYGDLFMVCFKNNVIDDFSVSSYALLYDQLFEDFEKGSDDENENIIGDEEEEEEEEEGENNVMVEELDISDNESLNSLDNEEDYIEILDYDINDYDK